MWKKIGIGTAVWILICLAVALWDAKSPRAGWTPDMAEGTQLLGNMSSEGIYYVDESCGARGDFLVFEGISLEKGSYRVWLSGNSSSDGYNRCYVSAESVSDKGLLDSQMCLYSGRETDMYEFELKEDVEDLRIAITYCGMGELTVTGLQITETYTVEKRRFWSMIFLGAGVLGIVIYRKRSGNENGRAGSGAMIWGFGAIVLAASAPLMTDSVINGTHLQESMARIEAFYDGLCQGMFPVRLSMAWREGYAGDGISGDLLLYIPALLRCMGFSLQASYKLYLVLLNALTCGVAYGCFRMIAGSRSVGLLCSMLYTLSVYRIYRMYNCGTVGETAAMVFLPVILLGAYDLYRAGEREHKKTVGLFLVGFTGLFQSNMTYWLLACGFVLMYAVLMWKTGLKRSIWIAWGQTTVLWLLANLWFIIPAVSAWRGGSFFLQTPPGERGSLQEQGMYLAQLLILFPEHGASWQGGLFSGSASEPAGVGISLLLAAMVMGYLIVTGTVKGRQRYCMGAVLGLAAAGCLCSMAWFPWDTVMQWGDKARKIVGMMRTPVCFLAFSTALLVLAAGCGGVVLRKQKTEWYLFFVAAMVLAVFCSSVYLLGDLTLVSATTKMYTGEGLGIDYKDAVRLGGETNAVQRILETVSLLSLTAGIVWSMHGGKKRKTG